MTASSFESLFTHLHGWCLGPAGGGCGVDEPVPDSVLDRARALHDGPVVAVSACLLGILSRYDGASKPVDDLAERLAASGFSVLPVCPEVLAGLGVPRPPMHFEGGDGTALLDGRSELVDSEGRSCSMAMRAGAARAMAMCREACASVALLKERSPSCGLTQVHVGDRMEQGMGVFAALASRSEIPSFSEEALDEFFEYLSQVLSSGR